MSTVAEKTYTPDDLLTMPDSGEDVLPGFQCRVAAIFPEKTAGKPVAG